jgi:hypothetical protein
MNYTVDPLKIFCTGNPKKQTVAYSLKDRCDYASKSTGWDFTTQSTLDRFRTNILDYNAFVNSSYIGLGVQLALMNIAYQMWMQKNIRGHIITIGTTLEYSSDMSQYAIDKRSLKQRSLELNDQTGITGVKSTYLILGGIANGEPKNSDYVIPDHIASNIFWVLSQDCRIPLLQLEGIK